MITWMAGVSDTPNGEDFVIQMYNRYKNLMFSTAQKYTANIADQEDIVQTSLERLIRIFSNMQPSKRCISATYVVYTVRSVSIDLLRKQGKDIEHCISLADNSLDEVESTSEPLDNFFALSEQAAQLKRVLSMLPAEERILLNGKYILNQTDKELAAILGCKPSSIRMKLTRARKRAMKLLQGKDR